MGAAFIVNARTHGDSCDLTLIFFAFLHEEKRGGAVSLVNLSGIS